MVLVYHNNPEDRARYRGHIKNTGVGASSSLSFHPAFSLSCAIWSHQTELSEFESHCRISPANYQMPSSCPPPVSRERRVGDAAVFGEAATVIRVAAIGSHRPQKMFGARTREQETATASLVTTHWCTVIGSVWSSESFARKRSVQVILDVRPTNVRVSHSESVPRRDPNPEPLTAMVTSDTTLLGP